MMRMTMMNRTTSQRGSLIEPQKRRRARTRFAWGVEEDDADAGDREPVRFDFAAWAEGRWSLEATRDLFLLRCVGVDGRGRENGGLHRDFGFLVASSAGARKRRRMSGLMGWGAELCLKDLRKLPM